MIDPREKILDAFLDETINDSRPGRSSAEIIRNIQQRSAASQQPTGNQSALDSAIDQAATTSTSPRSTSPLISPGSATPAVATSSAVNQGETFIDANPSSPAWLQPLAIAALLLATVSLFVWLLLPGDGSKTDRAATEGDKLAGKNAAGQNENSPPKNGTQIRPDDNPIEPGKGQLAENTTDGGFMVPEQPTELPDSQVATRNDIPENQTALVFPGEFQRNVVNTVAVDSTTMADQINIALNSGWQAADLRPAKHLELQAWANRLASRLLGRPLNAKEIGEVNGIIVQAKAPNLIREDLIEQFLEQPEYQTEFSKHWGRSIAWHLLGLGPTMRVNDPDIIRTAELITERIADNQPMDELAYQLLSAVGSTSPPDADRFNPASSYMAGLAKRFGKRNEAVAHIADAFMGQKLQCIQCHDQFGQGQEQVRLAEHSTQQEYFEFQSWMAQWRIESKDDSMFSFNQNFLPLGNEGQTEAALSFVDSQGISRQAFPSLGDVQPETNGFVAKVDRRTMLANLIAGSPEFREAIVDRVWANLLNLPMSGIDGNIDPKLAQLRADLGEQFAANNFELQWLVKAIVSSDAFAVGVGTDEQVAANNPFLGAPPRFNIFYQQLNNQRTAFQSLSIVARAYNTGEPEEANSAGLLARVVATAAVEQPKIISTFIPDNDDQWATSPRISVQLDLIAASEMTDEQKAQHVILAALGRPAQDTELKQALIILQHSENERTALQDVWWSLLNSVEYQFPAIRVRD